MSFRSDPTTGMVAANAHATDPLTNGPPRAVYCTVAGDLVCSFDGGITTVTLPIDAKTWHPISPTHIRATSTATVLLAY